MDIVVQKIQSLVRGFLVRKKKPLYLSKKHLFYDTEGLIEEFNPVGELKRMPPPALIVKPSSEPSDHSLIHINQDIAEMHKEFKFDLKDSQMLDIPDYHLESCLLYTSDAADE